MKDITLNPAQTWALFIAIGYIVTKIVSKL
jgi:hypothetical protein